MTLPIGFPFPDIDFEPTTTVVTVCHLVANDGKVINLHFDDGDHSTTKFQLERLEQDEFIIISKRNEHSWIIISFAEVTDLQSIGEFDNDN